MNRWLTIPAACCLVAFAVLMVILQGAIGRESASPAGSRWLTDTAPTPSASSDFDRSMDPANVERLSAEDAQQMLADLSGEFMRPWREWEHSPRRLYSRIAPRPVPSICAKVEMASASVSQENTFLSTITIHKGEQNESMPCIVDRFTKRILVHSDGQWLTEAEWLKKVPLPNQ